MQIPTQVDRQWGEQAVNSLAGVFALKDDGNVAEYMGLIAGVPLV